MAITPNFYQGVSKSTWIADGRYASFWLYAAIEPTTGTGHFLLLPDVTGECLELFLHHRKSEVGTDTIGVVLDSSASHRSSQVHWPDNMKSLYLLPDSPELNPAEQVFRHLRKRLSNTLFTHLDALQTVLMEALQKCWAHPMSLLHLTNYPCWVEDARAILSVSP